MFENGFSEYARLFDRDNPNWSPNLPYNALFLRAQETYLTNLLHARGHVFLNEVYDALGFERTPQGAITGWLLAQNHDNFVHFKLIGDDENPEVLLIDFNVDGTIYENI